MNFNIQVSEKDFVYFNLRHSTKWRPLWIYIIFISLFVLFNLFFFSPTLFGRLASTDKFFFTLRLIFLILSLLYILIHVLVFINARSSYRSNQFIQSKYTYTVNPEGVRTQTPSTDSLANWEKFYKVRGDEKLLALYISKTQAFIIPIHQLELEQKKELRKLLLKHVPPNKIRI